MATPRKRKPKNNKKAEVRYRRRTFMFDEDTEREAGLVKQAIRATTASEAVRYSVRKIAELMAHIKGGGRVYVDTKAKGTVALDIPPAP
jgi:hypothetical protein